MKHSKLLSKFKKKRFYYRLLISFSALSIIAVFITASVSWNIVGNKYYDQIRETNLHRLGQIQTFSDQKLYTDLMSVINDYFLSDYSRSTLENFYDRTPDSPLDYFAFYQDILQITVKSDFIDAVTLYRYENPYLVDSQYGINADPESNPAYIDRFLPLSAFKAMATGEKKRHFIGPIDDNRRGMTLIKSLPLHASFDSCDGFIAITISEKAFLAELKKNYQFSGGLCIIGGADEALLKDSNGIIPEEEWQGFETAVAKDQGPAFRTLTFGDNDYSITTLHSPNSDWQYLSFIHADSLKEESSTIRQLLILIVALISLMSLLIVQLISSRVYRPLNKLRNSYGHNTLSSDAKDDITFINDALSLLENQVDDMVSTLDENKDIMRYKLLMDIFYNEDLTSADVASRLSLCHLTFHYRCYCLIAIEIKPTAFHALNHDQQEYICTRIQHLTESWFSRETLHLTETRSANRTVTLLNLSPSEYEEFLLGKEAFLAFIESNTYLQVNMAISDLVADIHKISAAFKSSVGYLSYGFVYNYGNVFTADAIEAFLEKPFEPTLDYYTAFDAKLRSNETEALIASLMATKKQIVTQGCSLDDLNSFLLQLYKITIRACNHLDVFADPASKDQFIESFHAADTLDSSFEWLISILELFNQAYKNRYDNSDFRLIEEISTYIRNNPLGELSLSSIAEHFSVSPSHLSRLFKHITGDNMSVFIINTKLEAASEMLLKEPNKSIAEIANALGYYTPAYFTKLFKKKYQVTPSQYRKMKKPS